MRSDDPLAHVSPTLRAVVERAQHPDFFFVNIGANDGVTNDPIYPFLCRYSWAGIAVEPLEPLFEELGRNYARFPRVICERAAIATSPRPFYYIAPGAGDARPWMKQVGSLDPTFLHKTIDGMRTHAFDGPVPAGLDASVVRVDVPCLTFDELMAKHGASRVDFVNVDAEGLDYEIASTIDLARWHPAVLTLETAGMGDAERRTLDARFAAYGYGFLEPLDVFSSVYVARRFVRGRIGRALDRARIRVRSMLSS